MAGRLSRTQPRSGLGCWVGEFPGVAASAATPGFETNPLWGREQICAANGVIVGPLAAAVTRMRKQMEAQRVG